jgi:nucleoid-associated protein YgaU
MSKELIVAGGIVVACLGLTTIAFIKPAAKPVEPEVAQTDPVDTPPDRWSTTSSTGSSTTTTGNDPFGSFPTNSTGTTTDPFADPFANPGTSTSTTDPTVTEAPIDPVPTRMDPPPVDTMQERTHVVAKGDTLGDISKQYYGTTKNWKKIQEANKCDPNGLAVGQKLVIPAIASSSTASSAVSDSTSADGLYVVKKGDSYYRIAERELGDPSRSREIEKLNGVAAEDLRVGQKLKLPPRASSGSPTTTSGGTSSSTSDLPAGARVHIVKRDEYLVDISEKYYGTTTKWKRIADANPGLNPNHLVVGQKVVVPDAGGSSRSGDTDSSSTPVAGDTYVIKAGDTLDRIAKKTMGDASKWKEIAKVNPGVDPTRLMVGQKINLPKGAQSETPAPAPTPAPRTPTPPTRSTTFPEPEPFPAPTSTPAPTTFPAPGSDNPFPGSTSFPAPVTPVPAPAPADPWDLPPAPAPASGAAPAPQDEDPWAAFPGSR